MSLCTQLLTSLSIVQWQTSLSNATMLLVYSKIMTVDPRFCLFRDYCMYMAIVSRGEGVHAESAVANYGRRVGNTPLAKLCINSTLSQDSQQLAR